MESAYLTSQSRFSCTLRPCLLRWVPPGWHTFPPTLNFMPGAWAALPCISNHFDYLVLLSTLFWTFWWPNLDPLSSSPLPSPHMAHVHSGLSWMSLPLTILSHISITNFLLYHSRTCHVLLLFLFFYFFFFFFIIWCQYLGPFIAFSFYFYFFSFIWCQSPRPVIFFFFNISLEFL